MRYLTTRNRAILREMITTDFKVRYQGSVLGYLWSLLKPLFMFMILYVIFTYVFKIGGDVEHYPIYLLLGIVLWNFFSEATVTGTTSIVAQGDLIRKISIPRYLIVVASSVSALINLGLNMIVVFGFAVFDGIYPNLSWLLLPLVILELFILAQAVAFLLAAVYVKFRDINYVWELILQAGFYGTPILYPLVYGAQALVPDTLAKLLLLNPMAQIIQDARYLIANHDTKTIWSLVGWPYVLIPFVVIVTIAVVGGLYFKKQQKYFAENI